MSKETELSDKAIKDMHQYHYGVERYLKFARAVLARWGAPQEAVLPAPTAAQFALQALVAAGHVSQDLVNRALTLPGAPVALPEPVMLLEHKVGGSLQYAPLQAAWKLPIGVEVKLYANQLPERLPMTYEQVRDFVNLTDDDETIEQIVRRTEKHHGITSKAEGAQP